MKEEVITFTVEVIIQPKDHLIVGGRCGDVAIKLGTTFEIVYRYPPARTLEDYGILRRRIDERPVSLRVDKIYSYGHFLNELPPGMTAEIALAGIGGSLLKEGDVLEKVQYKE